MASYSAQCDHVEGAVEFPVAAAVEPVALCLAAGGLDGAGAGQCSERRLADHSAGVAGGDDQLGGADGADAALGAQLRHELAGDRFQLPVEIVDANELGALGCAMAAAVASGVYTDLKDAAKHMMKIKYRLEPNAGNAAVYARKYRRYRKVADALDGIWKDY